MPFCDRSLWQGTDHLLYVESIFFNERYKRFYFNDIQAIVMHRSGVHWVWTFVWCALALLFGLIAYFVPGTPHVSGTLLALSLCALAANLVLGPSCAVFLQTAVQRQKLATLRRVRTAAKAMNRIKAFAEEKQGRLEKQKPAEAARTQPNNIAAPVQGIPVQASEAATEKVPVGPFKPLLHKILFSLLFGLGTLAGGQLLLKNLPLGIVGSLMHAIAQIMVIVTLVKWYRHLKGTVIAKVNWLALVLTSLYTAVGYVLYFVASFKYPELNFHHWAMFKQMFEIQMMDHPLALSLNIFYAGGCLLLGLFGVLVVQKHTKRLEPDST